MISGLTRSTTSSNAIRTALSRTPNSSAGVTIDHMRCLERQANHRVTLNVVGTMVATIPRLDPLVCERGGHWHRCGPPTVENAERRDWLVTFAPRDEARPSRSCRLSLRQDEGRCPG